MVAIDKYLLAVYDIQIVTEEQFHLRKWDIVVKVIGSLDGFNLARKAIRRSRRTLALMQAQE